MAINRISPSLSSTFQEQACYGKAQTYHGDHLNPSPGIHFQMPLERIGAVSMVGYVQW
jgi:hypothetical protein